MDFQYICSTYETLKALTNISDSKNYEEIDELYNIIYNDLNTIMQANNEHFFRALGMQSYLKLLYTKAKNMPLNDKIQHLLTSLEKLKPHIYKEECFFINLRLMNMLSYCYLQAEDLNKAKVLLESAEDLYDKVENGKTYYNAQDFFNDVPLAEIKKLDINKMSRLVTNNIQLQAHIYNKLKLPHKYTLYTHTALRRQLEMKECTPLEWARKVARLGNYFIALNQLDNARYHLTVSYHVLSTFFESNKHDAKKLVVQQAQIEKQFLELSHHWVKYGMAVFNVSKKNILNNYFNRKNPSDSDIWNAIDSLVHEQLRDKEDGENITNSTVNNKFERKVLTESGKGDSSKHALFTFRTFEGIGEKEQRVPLSPVKTVEQARSLFVFTHKWLMRAKQCYDFNRHPAEYTNCALCLAELYENLAFFERDAENKYNVQKRRADVLEMLNIALKNCSNNNPIIAPLRIDVIRNLSQVQLELMALNLQRIWSDDNTGTAPNDSDLSTEPVKQSDSNKTLTSMSHNILYKKMEAATSINGQLARLCSQLISENKSQCGLDPTESEIQTNQDI